MTSPQYNALLQSIATRVADYRAGEIAPITPDHVDRWVNQFDADDRLVILGEMDRILEQFYLSRVDIERFMDELLNTPDLFGRQPTEAIRSSQFLNIQGVGQSQREMLQLLNHLTTEKYQVSVLDEKNHPERYIYLDDVLFSGNRALRDLRTWLDQPISNSHLHLIFCAIHVQGEHYLKREIEPVLKERGIGLTIWWNRKIWNARGGYNYECFWPMEEDIGDEHVEACVQELRRRAEGQPWQLNLFRPVRADFRETVFSSAQARHTIEQAFLRKGAYLLSLARDPHENIPPMGFQKLISLGFGALVVTYRNIANNCPLVLWWGNPEMREGHPLRQWHPLFPRRTYEEPHV